MNTFSLSLLIVTLFTLSACVDRTTADQRLIEGCKAGILAFSDEGDVVEQINAETIHDHAKLGKGFREVKLDLTITDGFHGRDESHSCIFQEEFGFGNMSHKASIYQLNFGGRIIGQKDYEIQGSLQDMQKLTNAVESVLH